MGMEWLIFLAGLWLLAPIPLLVALLISRHQLAQAREQLAAWKLLAAAQQPVTAPVPEMQPIHSADLATPTVLIPETHSTTALAPLALDAAPAPSALENALRRVSGWPRWLAPFLVQNIGWFIGGFCLVAGAVFLVANSSGLLHALLVWGSLSASSTLLVGAGYQLRRRALVLASNVLLILGLLLGTLALAMAVRLCAASDATLSWLVLSSALSALTLGAYAFATRLVSALVERSLPAAYPRYVWAVSLPQLALPLAHVFPDWRGLAALHLLLLGILWSALRRFSRTWLQHIFIDQRFSAYYAAGLLLYAAAVTGIHLTWAWPQTPPTGYGAVLLMLGCWLLFPVDAALQQWVAKYPLLSRSSLILYALSLTAILGAIPSTPAMLINLSLGSALYAWITWRYLTWPPLYLLLASLAGLYTYAVLQWLPPELHLLAATPGLCAMLATAYWLRQRVPQLARHMLFIFMPLLAALSAWSLLPSAPGMLAFLTCGVAGILGYVALCWLDRTLQQCWSATWWMTLAALAVAYAPSWLDWELQSAYGWLMLAMIYALCIVRSAHPMPWLAGMLTMLAAALFITGLTLFANFLLLDAQWLPLLIISAGLLFSMSIRLYSRPLFYGALLISAICGAFVKYRYFPAPGNGTVQFLLVIVIWGMRRLVQWWDDKYQAGRAMLGLAGTPTLSLLVAEPLQQAQVLLWLVGWFLFMESFVHYHPMLPAFILLLLAAISNLLLVVYTPLISILYCISLLLTMEFWPASNVFLGLAVYLALLTYLLPRRIIAVTCIGSIISSSMAFCNVNLGISQQWIPPLLALWQWPLIMVWRYLAKGGLELWYAAVDYCINAVTVFSVILLLLVIVNGGNGTVYGLSLTVLASGAWFLGIERDAGHWYKAGLWFTLGALYAFWQGILLGDLAALPILAPLYAMHSALLLLVLSILEQRNTLRSCTVTMQRALTETIPWLLALTLALLAIGTWTLLLGAWPTWQPQIWLLSIQHLAGGATLLLLSAWSILHIHWGHNRQVYALAIWVTMLLCYTRLLILGLAGFTPLDSAILLGLAIAAGTMHQMSRARPWYYLTLLLPLVAIFITPWQLASTWCAGVLLTSSIIYLSLASFMRQAWPLYLGVLALNAAVYLWAPLWAQYYGLWQLYLMPAALSALVVLHLHRRELRPTILHSGRLTALSLLYAGAGLDVFLRPELWIFILALSLGLLGVIIGIAWRIRAFLYTATIFLILNIGGQLRYFYREESVSRALILLLLGTLITAGMVLFNLRREALLQRMRIVRADLAQWE